MNWTPTQNERCEGMGVGNIARRLSRAVFALKNREAVNSLRPDGLPDSNTQNTSLTLHSVNII